MRFASIQCSKMRLRPGHRPNPAEGAYSDPPDSLAGFKGAASQRGGGGERERGRREGRGREMEERGREGKKGKGRRGAGKEGKGRRG